MAENNVYIVNELVVRMLPCDFDTKSLPLFISASSEGEACRKILAKINGDDLGLDILNPDDTDLVNPLHEKENPYTPTMADGVTQDGTIFSVLGQGRHFSDSVHA